MNEYSRYMFVFSARQWLGTPFHLGARQIGLGVDCAQLIVASALSAGIITDEPPEVMMRPRLLMPRRIRATLERYCHQVDEAESGDLYWLHTRRNLPLHLGIATDRGILHASYDAGRVVETTLPRELAIAGIWRFK